MSFNQHEADGFGEKQDRIDIDTKSEILELCETLGSSYFARDARKEVKTSLKNEFISG